jgi:hypothetical protein
VTGGTDKTAKFWDFELIAAGPEQESRTKVLSLVHRRTLQLDEGVTCLAASGDGRLLAVGLLDSTVKVASEQYSKVAFGFVAVLQIRIMFLGLLDPDPDPLYRGMDPVPDPDLSINKEK